MTEETMDNNERPDPTGRRRLLIKAAVGTGVAVAAHSTPGVSVVPAYGLTTSRQSDDLCYFFGWSSNNPDGKGWLAKSQLKPSEFPGHTPPDSSDPVNNSGESPMAWTWDIDGLGTFPASSITVTASGCVNTATGQFTISGLPTGYKARLYEQDATPKGDTSGCGDYTTISTFSASATDFSNGDVVTISASGQPTNPITTCTDANDDDVNKEGKVYWAFDIVPDYF